MSLQFTGDHPLRSVPWVWPEAYMYLHNHFAQFRRDIELADLPTGEAARFWITADKSYKLHINGRLVCRGPARGYQSHWPVDEVDVSPYLKRGHNWFAIEAYNPGISTFCYLHATRAGLLCRPADGPLMDAWNASTWLMRRSPAHATATARLSMQLDFQEHKDLRLDDGAWIRDEATPPADQWDSRILPPHAQHNKQFPFGQPPHDDIERRGIPLMRESLREPAKVLATARGESDAGFGDCENVSWHWVTESEKIAQWQAGDTVKTTCADGALQLTIEPTGPGRYAARVIDIGQYILGNVIVEIDDAAGGEILDFQHDQPLDAKHPRYEKPGAACMAAMANRLRLRAGSNTHEFYQLLGFKNLTLIARDVQRPLVVRLKVRTAGYPFTMTGKFESSDRLLNDIHHICRHTQRICAMDAYVDTPWREQAQWWGDARVQGRNTFYLDGDARLLARGIRSIAGQKLQCGLTMGHAPTTAWGCILPDFSLTWILTVWDHYWQTGDPSLFVEQEPRMREVLAYFESPTVRHPSGLLKYDNRFWLFEDWASLPKRELPAFLNLWYALTLKHVAKLYEAIGNASEAQRYRELAESHATLVERYFYDESAGVLRSALDHDLTTMRTGTHAGASGPEDAGRVSCVPSVHDQTLGLMLGICPQAHDAMMQRYVLPYLHGDELPKGTAVPSAFWCTYTLGVAIERGYGAEALRFIRRRWKPMLETGTTWENFDWTGQSCSHAWSAHPSYHLVDILAGVRQSGAGWSSLHIEPTFAEDVDHVRCVVPSPRGPIEVQWRRADGKITGRVSVPAQTHVTLKLPGQQLREQTGGELAFQA